MSCHKLNNFRIHPASLGQGGHDHENDVDDVDVFYDIVLRLCRELENFQKSTCFITSTPAAKDTD